jgi:hypothetical protein
LAQPDKPAWPISSPAPVLPLKRGRPTVRRRCPPRGHRRRAAVGGGRPPTALRRRTAPPLLLHSISPSSFCLARLSAQ